MFSELHLAHLSQKLTRWAYSIPMVRRPSVRRPSVVVGHTFKLEYLCLRFLGRFDQNSGFRGNRKPQMTNNGENGVSTFSRLLLIRSFLYLQVTRTCIKSRASSNFSQIGPLTTELAALERLKISRRLIMGKCYIHASSFIFDRIIIKVAGNQDRQKNSLMELLALEWRKFYTFELEYLWGQSANLDQILCIASLGVGKGSIMFWGRLDQNYGVHGNRKPPLTYNWESGVSTFSRLLLIQSFLYS